MNPAAIVVTGIGMRTAVGNETVQTCATIRTGLAGFRGWRHAGPALGDEGIAAAALEPDTGDDAWLVKAPLLCRQPLHEALWQARLYDGRGYRAALGHRARIGGWMATPAPTRVGVDPTALLAYAQTGAREWMTPLALDRAELVALDHAAGLVAYGRAMEALWSGEVSIAVVGAVESHLHRPWLQDLNDRGVIPGVSRRTGMVPGEAAAFVVLERADHAAQRGAVPLVGLAALVLHRETTPIGPEHPIQAEALSEAVHDCLDAAACPISRLVSDGNGERWRALESALVETRCLHRLARGWALWQPAQSIGDVGPVVGLVATGMALRAFARGYAGGGGVLVTASSLSGERAALALTPT